ncbi:MAG: glycoside hydrolase family 44 protein [Ardenticatenia bacterium]|nr:glycoside hydrolase family 44 protein [Ardenticatenia bacterium]
MRRLPLPLLIALALAAAAAPAAPAAPAVPARLTAILALHVDAGRPGRAIRPEVYGMNFADPALARELGLTVRRWGGNGTTRYHWEADTSNHAADWFFETLPEDNKDRDRLPEGSAADRFVAAGRAAGMDTVMTLPLIGWVARPGARSCGFSVAKYGPQARTDPWWPDCGDGHRPDGSRITGNDPRDANVPADPAFVRRWLDHLVARFGAAEAGGVRYYNLDNEPMLWHETHRDVFPTGLGYDGLLARTLDYARVVKDADPSALTLGPAEWGWTGYLYSALDAAPGGAWWQNPKDRRAHGDVPLAAWYLRQLRAAERREGRRLLDVFDLHYYPQAEGVTLAGAGNAATRARRLRSTRSLWDPSYRDESWIDEPVRLIPRMRDWVAAEYPGTGLAIGEYNWGALDDLNGALAQALVLGIFGREGVDLALLWDPPAADEPGAFAFRAYRNFDGQGGRFGETSLPAEGATDEVSLFAARRAADGAMTVVLVNGATASREVQLTVAGLAPASEGPSAARVFRYDAADLHAIRRQPDVAVGSATGPGGQVLPALRLDLPGSSITVLELAAGEEAGATATASATATVTATATATAGATATIHMTATGTEGPTRVATETVTPESTPTALPVGMRRLWLPLMWRR